MAPLFTPWHPTTAKRLWPDDRAAWQREQGQAERYLELLQNQLEEGPPPVFEINGCSGLSETAWRINHQRKISEAEQLVAGYVDLLTETN